jgi:hypothetical protein
MTDQQATRESKLAEALRKMCVRWRSANPHGTDKPMTVGAKIAYAWCAEELERELAAHDARDGERAIIHEAGIENSVSPELARGGERAEPCTETPGEFMTRMGADASKWAAEFRKMALRLGYSDMDEGWLIGWFASAIEHSCAIRSSSQPRPEQAAQGQANVATLREVLKLLDNVTATSESEADYLGQAENMLRNMLAAEERIA